MENTSYKIQLSVNAIPLNDVSRFKRRLFRHGGDEAFIVGETFQATYTVTNIGTDIFDTQVRKLTITINWPNGQSELTSYEIDELKPGDHQEFDAQWGVLAPGFALFSAKLEIGPGVTRLHSAVGISQYFPDIGPLFRDENNQILPDFSFFSVYGQTTEEFYQYWAMIFALLAILLLVIEKIVPHLLSFFTWLRALNKI